MDKLTWVLETRQMSDLRLWQDNPRLIKEKGFSDLEKSIDKFGLAEPLVIQPDGLIIGGHARFRVLIKKGFTQADCYVPNRMLTDEEYRELNIRLNANVAGVWDTEALANNWDTVKLEEWGMTDADFGLAPNDARVKEPKICPKCGEEI